MSFNDGLFTSYETGGDHDHQGQLNHLIKPRPNHIQGRLASSVFVNFAPQVELLCCVVTEVTKIKIIMKNIT